MTELTADVVAEHTQVGEFLKKLSDLGVYLPVPAYTVGYELTFDFGRWNDLPPEGWSWSTQKQEEVAVDRFKAAARAIGGRWMKNDPKASSYDDSYYIFTNARTIGEVTIKLRMSRDLVCERVAVGTTKKVIPAKPAQEATPEQVVEETVYERECKPLFGSSPRALEDALDEIEAEIVS